MYEDLWTTVCLIVVLKPNRNFYDSSMIEYSDKRSEYPIPKIPIFSMFFLRFLFYVNLYYFRFNIVLYNKEFPEKSTKMSEFRNSISILGPKNRNSISKIPIFSPYFLRLLFYINLYYFCFNIFFYIIKNFQKNRTKMSEFLNSISILGPKNRNSIPKIPIFSPYFLRFLFYINLYFFRFNIVFI